ncbi:MAG: hypothetical protein OXN89_22910 [Bryobacterales bacterium]|nr:hypothetical protein [Bryobacterales bacterium]
MPPEQPAPARNPVEMQSRIRNFEVSHPEFVEIWTFVALDRETWLIIAWLLGKGGAVDAARFILKVREAVSSKRSQISSDCWEAYDNAVEIGLGHRASSGRIVKVINPGTVEAVFGKRDEFETTYIERSNGDSASVMHAVGWEDLLLLEGLADGLETAEPRSMSKLLEEACC